MNSDEQMRAGAREQAKQIEAVRWLSVHYLAGRWGISASSVRAIPRTDLPYITFGKSQQRRYDPRDVERYEAEHKAAPSDEQGAQHEGAA